ncbi:MgtC/SapB family protein [Chelativorans xinjiangense]|uniref:MgtC/SapB family protein n=1 Tax=Chelativorans xinjiangense TaxID=2681485 RepID=UPI00135B0535|nr:MgtC/SapB family protein [Chelativorans xinjiangense]
MDPLIAKLGLALAIGLLVGLERGWRERDAPEHSRTAGIRTFGISGLLGGILAALSQAAGSSAPLVAGFLGFAVIFAWYKSREAIHDEDYSVTSVIAGLGVFALGAFAVAGDYRAAAAGGAALAAVLASREVLHGLLKRLTWIELRSALILAVMTAVVLPLLPNRTIDPWGGLNPWEIWFFTVLVAAISFLGYIAVRVLGEARGLLVSALAGAVVSSTAVTVALARSAKGAGRPMPLAGAASLAAMVSILRVSLIVILIEPRVFPAIAAPALAAAFCFGACGGLLLLRNGGEVGSAPAQNPFDLAPLLLFALFFAVVATASAALSEISGVSGLLATSTVSGALDADVAVLGAIRLVGGTVGADTAGQAVLAALASNAAAKLVLAAAVASLRFSLALAGFTLLALIAGFGVYLAVPA